MRTITRLLTSLVLIVGTLPTYAALPAAVNGEPLPSLAPMLEKVTPAVVNISTVNLMRAEDHPLMRDPFFRRFFELPRESQRKRSQSLGSGVIVDARRGYVLTNNHVIEKADEIRVTLHDGRELVAELLGADPETDVALLRIPAEDLTALPIADSNELRVGDFVVAIGNPFGLTQTVTSGIVSALGRSGLGIEGFENFIQTDASINPGNSGGPLVNLRGELVGINTAILAPSGGNVGIGFAIPVNMAEAIKRQIVEFGGIQRGTFGITVQNLTPDLARALKLPSQTRGAVVSGVEPGSAAADAGLRAGDLITRINEQAIITATDLQTQLALMRVGQRAELDVYRDGRKRRFTAQIADPFKDYVDGEDISPQFRGALLGEVVDDSSLGTNPGIAVGRVREDSNAWNSGLREGDVIFQINRSRTRTLDDLEEAADGRVYQIKLRRGERLVTLVSR
ncbi:DegQ family serine endoprotease [Thiosocius teredinicola]|uniref:DegQ family serine endoprotease n=1 Tax=Thiosocius teredinicola TaxID=1973002 RepID=UPI0009911413